MWAHDLYPGLNAQRGLNGDTERAVFLNEELFSLPFLEKRRLTRPCGATWGSTGFGRKAEAGISGKPRLWPFLLGFHGKGRWGRVQILGRANLNNFGGLWGIRAIPSCLIPGPGGDQARGILLWESTTPHRGGGFEHGLWINWFAYERYVLG